MSNSTFSVNSASSGPASGGGGGIYNWYGTVNVSNSTFAYNSADTWRRHLTTMTLH